MSFSIPSPRRIRSQSAARLPVTVACSSPAAWKSRSVVRAPRYKRVAGIATASYRVRYSTR